MVSRLREKSARKGLGAYYSPKALVEPMVSWAIRKKSDAVLDPSCGGGVFLESAARRLLHLGATHREASGKLHGLDLNDAAIRETYHVLEATLDSSGVDLRSMSFFSLDPGAIEVNGEQGVDTVIGNPPYIRYQAFNGSHRSQALLQASRAGVRFSQLTSSWAPFVTHAASFLKIGGRMALILPAELIHSAYARPVRKFLREHFSSVAVISFRRAVFPEVQEEVVVLFASGKSEVGGSRLLLAEAEDPRELFSLDSLLAKAETFTAGLEPTKWSPGHSESATASCLSRLQQSGLLIPLSTIGKANIGFVSGANEFFVLSPAEAKHWALPEPSLRNCVIRARQVPGVFVTRGHVRKLMMSDERCLLWEPKAALTRHEVRYIKHGVELDLHQRFKCRVRSPWYKVPGVIVPDAFLTYMSDFMPRLCLNEAKLVASNTLLTVRLQGVPRKLRRAFVGAFYNSATLLSCERIGRSYGGGVLKLEPSEADRVLVPKLAVVERHCESLAAIAAKLDEALRNGRHDALADALAEADNIVLAKGCECHPDDIAELIMARGNLLERRRSRSRRRSSVENRVQLRLFEHFRRYVTRARRPHPHDGPRKRGCSMDR